MNSTTDLNCKYSIAFWAVSGNTDFQSLWEIERIRDTVVRRTTNGHLQEAGRWEWRAFNCCVLPPLLLIVLFVACSYFLSRAFEFPTDDEVIAEVVSPDRAYVAVIVLRQNPHLAPAEGGGERVLLTRATEIFVPDRKTHIYVEPIYDDGNAYGLSVKWKDKRTLTVSVKGCW